VSSKPLALGFSRRSVLEFSQFWLVLASFPPCTKSALESSPSSMPMVLGSSQISKQTVLVFRAAMDILDDVASSVDICRAEMDNVRRLNKFSRTDQNCKFARIQVVVHMSKFSRNPSGYLSTFVRKDPSGTFCHSHWPWNTSSHMDLANKSSHNPLAN